MIKEIEESQININQEGFEMIKEDLELALKYYEVGYARWHDLAEAVRRSLKALNLQIPKKPTLHRWYECPSCKSGFGATRETPNPKAYKYCYHCGQKLNWN